MTPPRASALRIETPEGVVFSLRLASPVLRALAWAVDARVLAAAATVIEKGARVFAMLGTDWATALDALRGDCVLGGGRGFKHHPLPPHPHPRSKAPGQAGQELRLTTIFSAHGPTISRLRPRLAAPQEN